MKTRRRFFKSLLSCIAAPFVAKFIPTETVVSVPTVIDVDALAGPVAEGWTRTCTSNTAVVWSNAEYAYPDSNSEIVQVIGIDSGDPDIFNLSVARGDGRTLDDCKTHENVRMFNGSTETTVGAQKPTDA